MMIDTQLGARDFSTSIGQRERSRQEPAENIDAPTGKEDAERSSGKAEHKRLIEHLHNEAVTRCAESRAYSKFFAAAGDAGEQEAGDVDTGEQEQKTDSSE